MLTLSCRSKPPQAGRCAGCGCYREELQRGRPAWCSGLPGRAAGARYCPDCRAYLERAYSRFEEPGFAADGDDAIRKAVLRILFPAPPHDGDLPNLTNAELTMVERRIELQALLDLEPPSRLSECLAAVRQEHRRRGR